MISRCDSERRELRARRRGCFDRAAGVRIFWAHLSSKTAIAWSAADDLIGSVWGGRIVSDLTLDSRINAVRKALGDSGKEQRLIQTIARKGVRFLGEVTASNSKEALGPARAIPQQEVLLLHRVRWRPGSLTPWPDKVRLWHRPLTGSTISNTTGRVRSGATSLPQACRTTSIDPLRRARQRAFRSGRRRYLFRSFCARSRSVVEAADLNCFALLGILARGARSRIVYAIRHPERQSSGFAWRICSRQSQARPRRLQDSAVTRSARLGT